MFGFEVRLNPLNNGIVVRTKFVNAIVLTTLAQCKPVGIVRGGLDRINMLAKLRNVRFRVRECVSIIRPAKKVAFTLAYIRKGGGHVMNAGSDWSSGTGKTSRELRFIFLPLKQKTFFGNLPWLSACYSKALNNLYSGSISRIFPLSIEPERLAEWHNLLYADHGVNYIMLDPIVDNECSLDSIKRIAVDSVRFNHLLQLPRIDASNADSDQENRQFSDKPVRIEFFPKRLLMIIGIGMFISGRWISRETGRYINNSRTAIVAFALMLGGVILALWSV